MSNGKDNLRPVSTTSIPGTPWCVVWTNKNTVFYFNPSTKTSVWDRPSSLRERKDVDDLISKPPPPPASAQATTSSQTQKANNDSKSKSASDDHPSPSVEKDKDCDYNDHKAHSNNSESPTADSFTKTNSTTSSSVKPAPAATATKKDAPTEIETEVLKKRDSIPFEERVETFTQMLDEKEVKPTSTFQRELSKIVFDPRYLLLTSTERKEVFEKYCHEKIELERQKRRQRIKQASDDFKILLDEAKLNPKSTYREFHDTYSSDQRYLDVKAEDRNLLFDDHIALLRRSEREANRPTYSSSDRRPKKQERVKYHQPLDREAAENCFNNMLIELITDIDLTWHDARRILKKHPQYELLSNLSSEWKESTFVRHCQRLVKRRRDKFHQLLDETSQVTLDSNWRDIRRIIREDPRYIRFSSNDKKCEREFKEFLRAKISQAKANFRELLKETKLIDSNTRKTIEESEHQHLIAIIGTLQSDERYRVLEPLSDERRKVLLNYIEELAANASTKSQEEKVDQQDVGDEKVTSE